VDADENPEARKARMDALAKSGREWAESLPATAEAARKRGDLQAAAEAERWLGVFACWRWDWSESLEWLLRYIQDQAAVDESKLQLDGFWTIATALWRLGDFHAAAAVIGFARENFADQWADPEVIEHFAELEDDVRRGMDADQFTQSSAVGAPMDTHAVIALVQAAAADHIEH
jgi:hypothetical protein